MSEPTLHLKPAPDRRVRREDGELLAEAGEHVLENGYWNRRLADEDVVLVAKKAQKD